MRWHGLRDWLDRGEESRDTWAAGRLCACSDLDEARILAVARTRIVSLTTTLDYYDTDSYHGDPAFFYHPSGCTRVLLWPVRLEWGLGWMPEQYRRPQRPEDLAAALARFPPRPSWQPVGDLVDPACSEGGGPILDAGTTVRVGGAYGCNPPGDNGFDAFRQDVEITSVPWLGCGQPGVMGTLANVQIRGADGSRGPCVIARLALVPLDELLLTDPSAAAALREELRAVGPATLRVGI
jgi:hypothetical protein